MTKQPPPRHITIDYLAAKYPMIDAEQIKGMHIDIGPACITKIEGQLCLKKKHKHH